MADSFAENVRRRETERGIRVHKENSSKLLNSGRDSKSKNYGAANRMNSPDKKDKIMQFEKDNNVLKQKGTLLTNELTKMNTKLRRIQELMRSRVKYGEEDQDFSNIQAELVNECDEIKN